jgi:diguanylate cyclase (GGDEF)-like protein/PAS domain S-box-containing protein
MTGMPLISPTSVSASAMDSAPPLAPGNAELSILNDPAYLQLLLDSLSGMFFTAGGEGWAMKFLSQGCLKLTGYTCEELVGQGGQFYNQITHPEDLPRVLQAITTAMITGKAYEVEYRIYTKSGELKWLWEKGNSIFARETEPLGIQGLIIDISPLRAVQETLSAAESKWRSLIQHSCDLVCILAADGAITYLSPPALERLLGFLPDQLLGVKLTDLIHPQDLPAAQRILADSMAHPEVPFEMEYRLCHRDGTWRTFSATSTNLLDDPAVAGIVINHRDVTASYLAELRYQSIFENAIEGIFQTTPDGTYLSANPSLAKIYGYDSPAALQLELRDIAKQLYVIPHRREEFMALMLTGGQVTGFESQVYRRDGSVIWISENARMVRDREGQVLYFEGSVEDITDRKQAEQKIHHQAFHDALTGLPNRTLFDDRLAIAIAHAHRYDQRVAVMFLDLDRFKTINDTLGHTTGDQLIQQVADRLSPALREIDTLARWGGDEFIILLPNLNCAEDGIKIAERLLHILKPVFNLKEHALHVRCSIGIAFYPDDGEDAPTLLRNADSALYRAKERGRNNYQLYRPEMNCQASELLILENQLHRALERQQLVLHYQPLVTASTGEICRFEALVRWQHPQRGLVLPQDFITIAEENGLIIPIGEWVLQTACAQCRAWQDQGFADLGISVNLSPRQFQQPHLAKTIARILKEVDLAPQYLEIEITETIAMQNFEITRPLLEELKQMGIRIAFDDFGTGYSSLGYLKRFPLTTLKLDRSFMQDLPQDPANQAITTAVMSLGQGLGLDVVAEGVETPDQLSVLQQLGCNLLQGYLFSRPVTAIAATQLLQNQLVRIPLP